MADNLDIAVEFLFYMARRGHILTGTIGSGRISVGEHVCLRWPGGEATARVSDLECRGKRQKSAAAGDEVGVVFAPDSLAALGIEGAKGLPVGVHIHDGAHVDTAQAATLVAQPATAAALADAKLHPAEILTQLVSHGLLLWSAWSGVLGYLGMQVLFAAEVLLISITSIPLYLTRGVVNHLVNLLMLLVGILLPLLFIVLGYGFSSATRNLDIAEVALGALGALDWNDFYIAICYVALRLAGMLIAALVSGEARLSWARSTLTSGGVTTATLFVMAFATFAGGLLTFVTRLVFANATLSAVLSTVAVAIHFALSLLIQKMPQQKLKEIAENPYEQ